VSERLAEEGHAPRDDPGADDPAQHGHEAAADEGALDELQRERIGDEGHERRP
jgi:hypothetical protein